MLPTSPTKNNAGQTTSNCHANWPFDGKELLLEYADAATIEDI
jgi:hypothetical protein